jgi:predicted porin
MKRLALFAGAASMCLGAAAQSSVTLYGVVDMGLRHVKNGDASASSLSSNGNNTSRIGFKGVEDLGDGLKVGFQLESGLTPDNGASSDATRFFNRRSTLSLYGSLGELRLGRDYSVTYLGYEDYDVWSDIGLSSVSKFESSLGTARDTAVRSDNQVAYFTPANWVVSTAGSASRPARAWTASAMSRHAQAMRAGLSTSRPLWARRRSLPSTGRTSSRPTRWAPPTISASRNSPASTCSRALRT